MTDPIKLLSDAITERILADLEQRVVSRLLEQFSAAISHDLRLQLSEQEAAAALGVAESFLAERRRAGKISYIADGKFPRYTVPHLLDYLHRHEVRVTPRPAFTYSAQVPVAGGPQVKLTR